MKTQFYFTKSILTLLTFFSICFVSSLTLVSCSKDDDAPLVPIAINTSGVYVAGHEFNGVEIVAKLWKNGVATNLSDGTKTAYTTSVFVTDTLYEGKGGYQRLASVLSPICNRCI